jgi:hypothetical protein
MHCTENLYKKDYLWTDRKAIIYYKLHAAAYRLYDTIQEKSFEQFEQFQ